MDGISKPFLVDNAWAPINIDAGYHVASSYHFTYV